MKKNIVLVLCVIFCGALFAQQGKNGALTVTTTISVNEYTYLTANANTGNTSITVATSAMNAHGRFAGNLTAGDLIMIIQLQGATLNGSVDPFHKYWGLPNDSSWGAITNYNNCGNYEFAEVNAVPNGTTINLDCGLQYNYTISGKVEVVRVPRYSSLTINNGGTISCDTWDSAVGGIISVEVENNTVINTGGAINATGLGFRGGALDNDSSGYGIFNWATNLMSYGKQKGEGVGGFTWAYAPYGFKYCMGAPGNAGGGANAHNAGGGGGANGGVVANYINGYGNPDVSTNNYRTAWNLEDSWLSTFTSSGGGRGGYTFSANTANPLTTRPNNNAWGGDNRSTTGGRGGRPLDYSTGRLFMAGGGGAGDQDNNNAGAGGNGGGLVYLMSYGTVSGGGQIIANGANGQDAQGTASVGHAAGIDGAGGAGGGGTLIVNSVGNISGITLTAAGGTGGNQVVTTNLFTNKEAEGPGGGGGGGYIGTSNLGLGETANGGVNGTTNSSTMANFPPNGATIGGAGTTNAAITNFYIITKNDTICSGQSATLTASLGGNPPGGTTIEWYSTQTGGSPIASGGTYTTPVLFANTTYYVGSCPGSYRIAVNVIISGSASTTISPNKTICKGTSDTLKATGGTAYSWSPATGLSCTNCANTVATPTVTTTYTCTITTACGPVKDSVKITVSPLPTVTLSSTVNPVCAGKPTTITASGGSGYTWSTGATTSSITVTPGSTTTYSVSVSNGTCTKDTTYKVTVNPLPSPTITANPNPICPGSSTTISASGGSGYTWNTGATTSSITVSPNSNTTYTVTVSNGTCTKDTTITITVSASPTVTIVPPAPNICSNGSVVLTGNGATSYVWSPATGLTCTNCTSPTANPTVTTTYTVIGTNAAGCKDTANVTVTVTNAITAVITPSNDSICSGNSTTLTGSGGALFKWSTGATTSTITVSPGITTTYSLTVTNGPCKDSTTKVITVTPSPTPSISATNNPICSGNPTTITASGGTTYKWNTGPTTSSITVNPTITTSYTAAVSNGKCIKDTSITITVTATPTVTISPPNPSICPGGSVTLNASGATSYVWSPATGLTCTNCPAPTATPTANITYTVIGTSAGCTDTTTVTVTVVSSITATISPPSDSVCKGSFTTLTAGGGANYAWSNGASTAVITINPLINTNYSVVVSSSGCSDTAYETVKVLATPTVSAGSNVSICNGGSTVLTASGGSSYTWKPSTGLTCTNCVSPTASPTITTTYTVIGSNAAGCTDSSTVTVTVANSVTASINPPSDSICNGSFTILTASGGSTYAWSNGASTSAITINPSVTTNYSVIVSSGACSDTAYETVKVFTTPTVTAGSNVTICTGGSAVLTASGASSYTWKPSTGLSCTACAVTTANPTITTTYTVVGSNGTCTDSAIVKVTVASSVTASINPSAVTICSSDSTTLVASGGSTYSWSTGKTTSSITVTPGTTTVYKVIVSSGTCVDSAAATVTVNPSPTVTISPNASICTGDSAILTVTGGGTYLWSNSSSSTTSTITVVPSSTTTYTAQVNLNGCIKDTTVTVTVNTKPVITFATANHKICAGASDTLAVASSGGTYSWSTGQTTSTIIINPTTPTSYSVTVSNGGCSTDTVIRIGIKPLPIVTLQGNTSLCQGDSATLVATGGGTYLWSTGQTIQNIVVIPSGTTTYSLAVTNGGCTKDTTMMVTVNPTPIPAVNGPFTVCRGESVNLIAAGGTNYDWSPSTGLDFNNIPNPTATPASTTDYVVTISNSSGCSAIDSILVKVMAGASGSVCCDTTMVSGGSKTLSVYGAGSGSTYKWSPNINLTCTTCTDPVASPTITTWYYVTITDSNGCERRDSVLITIEENPCGSIFIANAFSPNGDGHNDYVFVRGKCITKIDLGIYDRWGNKVFETTDVNVGWDGNYKGQPMQTGTYVYYLEVTRDDGTVQNLKGNITLVR